jgi:hypothetical protein
LISGKGVQRVEKLWGANFFGVPKTTITYFFKFQPTFFVESTAVDFLLRPKYLDLSDYDPELFVQLDPDAFVKDLKDMDTKNWDPLPLSIM